MATQAQIKANQENAQNSTGPRTPEGKAQSAANSRKDGLNARTLCIPDHQRAEFELYESALLDETNPQGPLEQEYFQRLLTCGWILRRARALEIQLLFQGDTINNEDDARKLQRIARYRRDLERSHDRALLELRQLQTQRAQIAQQTDPTRTDLHRAAPLAIRPRQATPASTPQNEPNSPRPSTSLAPPTQVDPRPVPPRRLRSA
jgi:hypothetical protein